MNPSLHKYMPMYISGYVIETQNDTAETYIIDSCLMDSGASSANYVSQDFVDKYIDIFQPHILAHNSSVRLGDSKTKVAITHIVTLNISFMDSRSITHEGLLNFSIMKMQPLDMIIGIESILFSFYDLFLDMLRFAKQTQDSKFNLKTLTNINFNPYGYSKLTTEEILSMISTGFTIPHSNMMPSKSASAMVEISPTSSPSTPFSPLTLRNTLSNRNLKLLNTPFTLPSYKQPATPLVSYKNSHSPHTLNSKSITPQRSISPHVSNTQEFLGSISPETSPEAGAPFLFTPSPSMDIGLSIEPLPGNKAGALESSQRLGLSLSGGQRLSQDVHSIQDRNFGIDGTPVSHPDILAGNCLHEPQCIYEVENVYNTATSVDGLNAIESTYHPAYDTIFKAPPIKNSFFQIPYDNSNHNLLWDGLYSCTYTNSQINNYDNDNDTSTIPIIDIHDDDDVNYDDLPPLLEHIDAYAHAC